jgi:Domain of unknown function (DUF5679)
LPPAARPNANTPREPLAGALAAETTRSAVEELPNLLSWGDHHLGGTVIMATATSTGYCMKCKAQREIKNAKQVTMKNGRPATEGTCPVCSTKIFKIGAIK